MPSWDWHAECNHFPEILVGGKSVVTIKAVFWFPFRFELCPGPTVGQGFLAPGFLKRFRSPEDHFSPQNKWSSGCPTGPGRPACDYSRKYCSICAFYSIFAFWSCKSHCWWMQNTLWTWDSNLIHEEPQCNQLQLADSISSLHLVCLVEQLNQGADATADNASAKATQIVTWNRRIWVKGVAMGFNEVSVTFIKQNSWCHLLCQIQFHWIRNSRFQWCY